MDTKRWQRIAAIFDEAVEAAPDARAAVLDRHCAGDPDLRREVEALLAADAQSGRFDHGIDAARAKSVLEWAEQEGNVDNGERIGPWCVICELGRGGMGVVLLAERADGQFEQRAALKLIKRGMDSEAVQARFLRERQILARLQHPHIAHLLDGGIAADGRPYFAMEFVDGQPLLRHCAEHSTKLDERIRLFLDVCAAVQFAHGQLVVHRDIKPSNVLVTTTGAVKLLDFGIATLLDDVGGTATIDAQFLPLTPAYAAPEQLRGEPVTTATDIYSLGCVLYELLTAKRPLVYNDTAAAAEIAHLQATTDPAAPSKVAAADAPVPARKLRGDLDTILLKALQREPQRRYTTAAAFADDLQRFRAGLPILARREHAWYRVRKFVGRHRVGVAAAVLGIALLVAALASAVWQAHAKAREAQVSRQVTEFLIGLFRGADPSLSRGGAVTAQDLLDQGTERLRSDLHMEEIVRARLLHTVATTYTALGLYDRALPLAQQALATRRRDPTRNDADVAESLAQVGRIERLDADLAKAEPLLREALQLRRSLLGRDAPDTLESLDELGMLLRNRGQFAAADVLFREAHESAERRYGSGAIETARYLDDYAANLDEMGKRAAALDLYRNALAIREQQLGADDAEVATSLLNLGVHMDEAGDHSQARQLLERALAIRRKIFGAGHPLVAFAEIGLAGAYEDENRLDDAERSAADALAILRQALPQDHPRISEALNMLATIYMLRHDYADALPLMREVLARFRRTEGDTHPDTLTAKNNLAYALTRTGLLAEAEQLQRDALAQSGDDNGQGNDAMSCQNLATTLEQEKKFAEAVTFQQRALVILKKREGEASGNVAIALRGLALAEQLNGDSARAEKDFRAALAMGERLLASHKYSTYEWKVPLADLLVHENRCAEAMPVLDSALAELDKAEDSPDPEWRPQAQLLLGSCRSSGGRREEGAAMQAAARAALRQLPGVEVDLYPKSRELFGAASAPRR